MGHLNEERARDAAVDLRLPPEFLVDTCRRCVRVYLLGGGREYEEEGEEEEEGGDGGGDGAGCHD